MYMHEAFFLFFFLIIYKNILSNYFQFFDFFFQKIQTKK